MARKVTALYENGCLLVRLSTSTQSYKSTRSTTLKKHQTLFHDDCRSKNANITIAVFFSLFSVWCLCKPRAVYCSSFHFLFLVSSPSCLKGSRLLVRTFVLVLKMPGAYFQLFRSPRITRIRSAAFLSPYVSL